MDRERDVKGGQRLQTTLIVQDMRTLHQRESMKSMFLDKM